MITDLLARPADVQMCMPIQGQAFSIFQVRLAGTK